MKILIVGLVKNEQLLRLKEEGEKRDHQVDGCYSSQLVIDAKGDSFAPKLLGKSLESYDLIYIWATGKRRWEWYVACHYLSKKKGTIIVNEKVIDPSYLLYLTPAADYLKQIENNLPFPKSAIVLSEKAADEAMRQFEFPLILKSSTGRQGKGVFKIKDQNELKKKVKELLKVGASLIIREFIPNDGDVRIFTVGYKAIGAMKRTPVKKGEFRSNISQGGKGEIFELDKYPNIRDIAEKISKITRTQIAGVDVMLNKNTQKPYILEINPGPQFLGLEKYTNTNAALEIIKYFEKLIQKEE